MKLMTKELEAKLPRLYATEDVPAHKRQVLVKFFTPDSNWTWYVLEYDPQERIAFGYVDGHEAELGYFSLDEMESVRGPLGLPIEHDLHFLPMTLEQVQAYVENRRYGREFARGRRG